MLTCTLQVKARLPKLALLRRSQQLAPMLVRQLLWGVSQQVQPLYQLTQPNRPMEDLTHPYLHQKSEKNQQTTGILLTMKADLKLEIEIEIAADDITRANRTGVTMLRGGLDRANMVKGNTASHNRNMLISGFPTI